MKTVIFDIDGTIADLTHRLHFISGRHKDYDSFFAACADDIPIFPVLGLMDDLRVAGNKIVLASGRTDKIRSETECWLNKHNVEYDALYMRVDGDYRRDDIVKKEILGQILSDGFDVSFVVDDRDSVVKMWRENGLTCFQCREWVETETQKQTKGLLTLMVAPSGAGKTHWLRENANQQHVISSDQIREDLCGDFKCQDKNNEVFHALHQAVKARIDNGLPCIVDATNLRRKDRLSVVALAGGGNVKYIVIDRPMEEKRRDGGWRNELGFDLLQKHQQTFNSQIKDILSGDGLDNVEVTDLRRS